MTRPAESNRIAPIAAYAEQVRNWLREGPVTLRRIETLRGIAARLVLEPLELTAAQRAIPPTGYGRHLLHRDDEAGFVVIAMVWPPGIEGLPHDHGTFGVVAVLEGDVEVTDYDVDVIDPGGERVRLRERSRVRGGPGATAFVLPPHDVHRVRNASPDRMAISIHTYGRDLPRCRVIDPTSGQVTWIEPQYDSWP